ncbi:hypothetical protein, partial [Rubritalea profundi]|uniref:hypothetical protein n=1 Tax=Rubritalea profundi TaxID=1658618 RepID=UPI00197FB36B
MSSFQSTRSLAMAGAIATREFLMLEPVVDLILKIGFLKKVVLGRGGVWGFRAGIAACRHRLGSGGV